MADRETRRRPRHGGRGMLAAGVCAGVIASFLPMLAVVRPGPWMLAVIAMAAAVPIIGWVGRICRAPVFLVAILELATWAGLLVVMFPGVIDPRAVPVWHPITQLLTATMREVQVGVAPLAATYELSFTLIAGFGLVAVITDQLAVSARLPLTAGVVLITVSLIPTLAVPGPLDVFGFIMVAVVVLWLLRTETRTRLQPTGTHTADPPAAMGVTAIGVGVVAVVGALVITPLLPAPEAASTGFGTTTIDASLDLGKDLRRPQHTDVLALTTDAASAPYLRVATLSSFTGKVWHPDAGDLTRLDSDDAFGGIGDVEGLERDDIDTRIQVQTLTTRYLPVPFPAVHIDGLDGRWRVLQKNRTVIGDDVSTRPGLSYTVSSRVAEPTLEQIRSVTARGSVPEDTRLPADVPADIAQLARQVTAGTSNDYDALIALQDWFRGPDFEYSLTAPVDRGFDGSGLAAIDEFLRVKEGYCIHFASAFAVMARELDMPTRIVVGYLPGTPDTSSLAEGGALTYTVSSSQLHSWPEVFFPDIGWVPFEPTKSLGVPTAFLAQDASQQGPDDDVAPTIHPSTTPTATADTDDDVTDADKGHTAGSAFSPLLLLAWLGGAAGVMVILLTPWAAAEIRRRRRERATRAGDVLSGLEIVREAAIDLRIPIDAAESPRALAMRLVEDHAAPADEMHALLDAVERAVYAPAGTPARRAPRREAEGAGIADAADEIRRAMYAAVRPGRRLRALLIPRSLIVRPGSEMARAGASVTNR